MWALIASLYVGNVMLLALNLPLVRLWVKVLEIPRELLTAAILVFATLGVYSISGSVTELLVMYLIGVLGFFMRRFDFPVAPVILGVILGPLMEAQFRRTLLVSDGDFGAFLERPFAVVLFVLAILALVLPVAASSVRRVRGLGEETRPEPRDEPGSVCTRWCYEPRMSGEGWAIFALPPGSRDLGSPDVWERSLYRFAPPPRGRCRAAREPEEVRGPDRADRRDADRARRPCRQGAGAGRDERGPHRGPEDRQQGPGRRGRPARAGIRRMACSAARRGTRCGRSSVPTACSSTA